MYGGFDMEDQWKWLLVICWLVLVDYKCESDATEVGGSIITSLYHIQPQLCTYKGQHLSRNCRKIMIHSSYQLDMQNGAFLLILPFIFLYIYIFWSFKWDQNCLKKKKKTPTNMTSQASYTCKGHCVSNISNWFFWPIQMLLVFGPMLLRRQSTIPEK